MKVVKFGGAGLADGAAIQRAAEIIRKQGPCVVVASAMAGITDLLTEHTTQIPTDEEVAKILATITAKNQTAIEHLGLNAGLLDDLMKRLERTLYGLVYTDKITARLRDLVRSFGERFAVALLASTLTKLGQPATALEAEQVPISSLGPFGHARPDLTRLRAEAGPSLINMVNNGSTPVVTGFYGVDPEGHPTLFGRGGSDYVAALVGYAIQAECVELWKDVPGFMTADPRMVTSANLIAKLSYTEAAELAHFGAGILHPRAVEPLEAIGIPLLIRSFTEPEGSGTQIQTAQEPSQEMVRSVASKQDLAILRLKGPGMAYTKGVAKRVFDALAEAQINVLNMSTSQASFALLIHDESISDAEQALAPLLGGVMQELEVLPGRALVCVVGEGLGNTPGSAAKILDAVAQAGVNVEMISLGASDLAIDFIVNSSDRAAAMRALHARFLEAQ
jgi:aspartate kinase